MMTPRASTNILVVDDNPPTRYSTSRVLRSAGFVVNEAATGAEALAKANEPTDLIILDVNLPDLSGFDVCRTLRASERTARTPVIHLSATFVNDVDKVQGLDAGADGYLTHPVEPPVLIATVNAFLRTRHAEEAMRTSEAKFKAVFDNALNGIALLNSGMVYLDVNPSACRTLGRDRREVLGKHISAFLPHDAEDIVAEVNQALATAGSWRGNFSVLNAQGSPVHLEWSFSIHSDPETRLAITTDITERREIEADRERLLGSERAARADAERANRLKDDFLAALSHELRTPLNAILGWTQLLKRQAGRDDPDLAKAVDAIDRNARVQSQLIGDLLDVSKITAGKLSLDLRPFDPREAVESSVAAFENAARAKGVQIHVQSDPGIGLLQWDQARFQQVIWNLTDNALKFSRQGGRIDIRLISTSHAIDIIVRDTGRGIGADFLPYVFDRFRQEDGSPRRQHGGLGLGLAIIKQVIEAHGGTIQVTSAGEDQGATFHVHLPRLSEPPATSWSSDRDLAAAYDDLRGVHVVVVEDDDDARGMIKRVLRDVGAVVTDVSDVASALAALDDVQADVIISDIGMPTVDGYDFIRRVRQPGSGHEHLPAIALTAFARDEDRERVLKAGFQRHMSKPIDTLKLLDVISQLVKR